VLGEMVGADELFELGRLCVPVADPGRRRGQILVGDVDELDVLEADSWMRKG